MNLCSMEVNVNTMPTTDKQRKNEKRNQDILGHKLYKSSDSFFTIVAIFIFLFFIVYRHGIIHQFLNLLSTKEHGYPLHPKFHTLHNLHNSLY